MKILIYTIYLSMYISLVSANFDGFEKQLGIDLLKDSSAYRFDIPVEVYQGLYHSSLSDMRIINATGDYVPMRISSSEDKVNLKYTQTTLPIFTLNQVISETVLIPTTTQQVRKTKTGQSENYTVTTSKTLSHFMQKKEVQRENVLYVDASVIEDSNVDSLSLDWNYKTKGNHIFSVTLLGSNDLLNWNTIERNHKLIEVNTGSRKLLENTIQLHNRSFKFYQLVFNDVIVPEIKSVKVHLVSKNFESQLKWLVNDDYKLLNNNEIIIDTGGFFPVEAFEIQFSQKNIMTDVKISSSMKINKWRHSYYSVDSIYDISTNGINLKKNNISTLRSSDRYWRLAFDANINNKTIKSIKIGWRNQQIEFLAQGEAPFILLFGNLKIKKQASSKWFYSLPTKEKLFSNQVKLTSTLYSVKNQNKTNTNVQSRKINNNYGKWVFWSILLIVIVILFYMAYKLVNGEIRIHNDNENT